MKMSHEKIVQVSHQVMAAIEALDEVEIYEEPNTIRQQIVKILTDLMHEEEKIDRDRESPHRLPKANHSGGRRRMGDSVQKVLFG